jgi:hypothetical protein
MQGSSVKPQGVYIPIKDGMEASAKGRESSNRKTPMVALVGPGHGRNLHQSQDFLPDSTFLAFIKWTLIIAQPLGHACVHQVMFRLTEAD